MLAPLGLGPAVLTPSRTNGFMNMLEAAKKRVRLLTEELPKFPSLLISADEVVPQGRFAEAQAEFLEPDQQQVDKLVDVSPATFPLRILWKVQSFFFHILHMLSTLLPSLLQNCENRL